MVHSIYRKLSGTKGRGFTLIELMITIFVAAILAVIAIPSFKGVISRTNLRGANNDLATAMHYARTEAITRGSRVAVAASSSGAWADGWTVIALAPDPTDNVELRTRAPLDSRYEINPDPGGVTKVTFGPRGDVDTPVCFDFKDNSMSTQSGVSALNVQLSGSIHSSENC